MSKRKHCDHRSTLKRTYTALKAFDPVCTIKLSASEQGNRGRMPGTMTRKVLQV